MSPPASSGKQKESGLARLLGSGTSGILELFIFHPVDTIAKRLMTNQQKVFVPGAPLSQSFNNLGEAIFKDKHSATFFRKYTSLFPGLGYAGGYKVLQRIYKYGGQPYVKDYINKNHKDAFYKLFGEKSGKTIIHATAGSLIGIGEVALLPLDVLKIKRQTNPDTLKNRNIFKIFWDEGFGLYRGGLWTAARNAPGSFALFGGSAFVKEYLFGLKDYSKATFLQNFCASIGGAIASISVAQPLDVVKTRIQNRPFDSPETGTQIIRKMILKEGRVTPKLIVVGPKLVFSFTIAQQLIPILNNFFAKKWLKSYIKEINVINGIAPKIISNRGYAYKRAYKNAIKTAQAISYQKIGDTYEIFYGDWLNFEDFKIGPPETMRKKEIITEQPTLSDIMKADQMALDNFLNIWSKAVSSL
ncbi:4502_t:CDS:2 [Entrophospora sp. SA101]|nr:4502_t:CDS:2 [Entrophospora sp. SA101]